MKVRLLVAGQQVSPAKSQATWKLTGWGATASLPSSANYPWDRDSHRSAFGALLDEPAVAPDGA